MTDNASTSPDTETPSPESTPERIDLKDAKPASTKKKKRQPILVYLGIVCLLVAIYVGWRVADRKKWFTGPASNLLALREGPDLVKWATWLRDNGGPNCKAIADMLTSETLPPLLQEHKISNLDDLALALSQEGGLSAACEEELVGTWSTAAWVLALCGIGLIILDMLREKGMLPGGKPRPPA